MQLFGVSLESAMPSSTHHYESASDEVTLVFVTYLLSRLLLLHAYRARRLFPTFESMYSYRIPTFGVYASSMYNHRRRYPFVGIAL